MAEALFPLLRIARLRMGSDGAGITTLIAGAGCPLRCRWCINKRLLREAPAEPLTAAELLERVRIDDLYFRASGGGVTFGGGESLLHAAFLRRFRELCPSEWRICAETSLAVSPELLSLSVGAVDSFIVDCKDMDADIYRRYTGGDPDLMRENLRFLLEAVGPERLLVRVPLIPEYNTKEDQQRSAARLRGMGITQLELFDYVIRA
ncbi:MAG: radical SAM protein [Oscillospiraceae bacterium]|nr:radical SAM protein [Oscillospiraceae bacterium]